MTGPLVGAGDGAPLAGTGGTTPLAGVEGIAPVAAGPLRLVRPYAITGGRTRNDGPELPFETLVLTTDAGREAASTLAWEHRAIVRLCAEAMSIAEVAAHLAVPLGVARVLVGDLTEAGLIDVHEAATVGDRPDVLLLERVLDGLRQL